QPGEGAFYGPKLEFALKDRQGRSWQCGTIQLDMVLPGRLGASYVDRNDERQVPVMLHHAVLGSMGRMIGILLEHHEAQLPFWLAPEQVAILPIGEAQQDAARSAFFALERAGLHARIFDDAESLGRRLVSVHQRNIPAIIVIGA